MDRAQIAALIDESLTAAEASDFALTTDAHLLALASAHDAKLVTLDTGIPDAFIVPA
jgi:predicted nucleic acid-binding protein